MKKISKVKTFLSVFGQFTTDRHCLRHIYQHISFRFLCKGRSLSEADIPEDDGILLVTSGILNCSFTDDYGMNTHLWLGQEGAMVKPRDMILEPRNTFALHAVQDTTFLYIKLGEVDALSNYYPEAYGAFIRRLYAKLAMDAHQRNILFRLTERGSRLEFFRKMYTGLEEILPPELLENYLQPHYL